METLASSQPEACGLGDLPFTLNRPTLIKYTKETRAWLWKTRSSEGLNTRATEAHTIRYQLNLHV